MLLNIIIFLLSLVPSILIIVWMTRRKKEDKLYKKTCHKALGAGLLSVLPIVLVSGTLSIFSKALKTVIPPLAYAAFYNYIVLAFAEEIVKFLCLYILLKKKKESYSWADVAAFMVIIGTAFGLIEDIPYAIGASPIVMAVRGFTMGHVGYALITGWFYGKRIATGKRGYAAAAVLIPWFIHGTYDFSLSQELMDVSDNFAFLGVGLALLDIVLLALMIAFFVRVRKGKLPRYLDFVVIGIDALAESNEEAPAQPSEEAPDTQEGAELPHDTGDSEQSQPSTEIDLEAEDPFNF